MSTPPRAQAPRPPVMLDWALFSKHPGQQGDYGIISSSTARVSAEQMDLMIRHFSAGVPDGENTGLPDATPWVTFTSAAVQGVTFVGCAIREWPADPVGQVDRVGRTIVTTRFFCLPQAEFDRNFGSYLGFYDTVKDVSAQQLRDLADSWQLSLPATRRDRLDRFASVRETGMRDQQLDTALAATALLVDQDVVVTVAQAMGVRARIGFLDQVAALLPAGIAGASSAATWVDVRTRHPVRLAFGQGELGSDSAARLDPMRPPSLATVAKRVAPNGRPTAGARYAALLGHLLAVDANGRMSRSRLEHLLARLAADTAPRTFEQPGVLADRLALTAVETLESGVHDNTATLDDIRLYLRAMPSGADPDGTLLGLLATGSVPSDLALVARHWPRRAGPGVAVLVRDLAASGYQDDDLRALVAAPPRVTADAIEVLFAPAPATGIASEQAVVLGIDLVLARVPSDDPAWQKIRAGLLATPALLVQTVLRQLDTRPVPKLADLLRWLDPEDTHPLVRPYRLFLRPGRVPLEDAHLATLAALGPDLGDRAVRGLFALAIRHEQVKDAFPVVRDWLAGEYGHGGSFTQRRRDLWQEVIETMPEGGARNKLLELIEVREPKKWSLFSLQSGKDNARPAGPVPLDVRWIGGLSAHTAEDDAVKTIVRHRLPAAPAVPQPGEVSFVGTGLGQVAVMVLETVVDRRGPQAITPRWYGCYADFATAGGRPVELARAAQEAVSQKNLSGPLTLAGRPDPAELVDSFGFDVVANLAARLLDGSVTIVTGPDRLGLDYRLDLIEAIVSLLPVGASSTLSFTSFTDQPDDFKLAWSDTPPVVRRHAVPADALYQPAGPGLAGLYAARLRWTRAIRADTATVIGRLAEWTEPLDLDDVDDRLAIVHASPVFQWPEPAKAKELTAAREAARRRLAGLPVRPDDLAHAIAVLLADGLIGDVELAERVVDGPLGDGAADQLLADLLRAKVGGDPGRVARVRQGAAKLLLDRPEVLTGAAREALLGNPAAAVALLVQAAARGQSEQRLRELTMAGVVPELGPFVTAVLERRPLTESQLRQVAQFGEDAIALVYPQPPEVPTRSADGTWAARDEDAAWLP